MKNFWKFFIHSSCMEDEILYLKSRIIIGLLLIHIPITVFNIFFFSGYGDIIVYNNQLSILMSVTAILMLRFTGKFILAASIFSCVAVINVSVSLWATGGIHSIDIFWFMILSISVTLFISKYSGVILSAASMSCITVYYFLEKNGVRDFISIRMSHNITEDYVNVMVIFAFATFIHYFFAGSDKLRASREKETETKANELERTYQFLATNVNEIIGVHKSNGAFTYVSAYIMKALGYSPDEIIGKSYEDLLQDNSYVLLMNQEIQTVSKVPLLNKEGETEWAKIVMMPVRNEENEFDRFISTTQIITEEVERDLELRRIRKQIARDFHDEMGNKLAAITLNSNVLKNQLSDVDERIFSTLAKIERNSSSLYQNSRDFIWSIDSKSDNLIEVFTYIKDFAEDLLYTTDISFNVESEGLTDFTLPPSYSRHIVLLLKEAFTNAYKSSSATRLDLKFRFENKQLTILLLDNGVGFDSETTKKGNGLLSMVERAKKIGAQLEINSAVGTGTEIILKVDLP